MYHPLAVRRLQRLANLRPVLEHFIERQRAFQSLALDILHHQIVGADVIQRADMRVIQGGDGPRLALETFAELFTADLDRHRAVQTRVKRFEDPAHAAGPEQSFDPVRSELRAGG